jgi:hypothetical protein
MSEATLKNTTSASRRDVAAGALAILGWATSPAASGATAATAAPVDPVVTLWAKTQAVEAELYRVSDQHQALHDLMVSRRPGQPQGIAWSEWHRNDPDLARSVALCDRSNELCSLSSELYDQIAVAAAVTPAGIRAKAAAALSIWALEKSIEDEFGHYDLILNALREAAAGSASA